jgi:hypothetical protein
MRGGKMMENNIHEYYIKACTRIIDAGYLWEIKYIRELPPLEKTTPEHFFEQYVLCV